MDRRADPDEGEELLRLALSRPGRALARAAGILAAGPEPFLESYARQARGIVLRDRGETVRATAELRRALAAAVRCGLIERQVDVRASLGAALVMQGRTADGLAELDAAASAVQGRLRATVLMRRAYVLTFLGRYDETLRDLRGALAGMRRSGDAVWEARTLNNRGMVLILLGEVSRAERDVLRAEQMFAATGQRLEAVHALHNRAVLAYLNGDLPQAFARYDRAAVMYAALGTRSADLLVDRCQAYLAAGLTSDAVSLAADALSGEPMQPRHRAEVQLMLATAALADGDPMIAGQAARRARAAFARQGRGFWVARSALVVAQADFVAGGRRAGQLQALRPMIAELVRAKADEAAIALLLAGRLAVARGLDGHPDLSAAARFRASGSPQVQATAWLAMALDREQAGDRAGVLRACRRGLDALAAHREALASTQLRALASRHGDELAAIALRHVLSSGDARALLTWSERWRAAALTRPALRPPQDPALGAQLAAMRAVARAVDESRERGLPVGNLVARLSQLEASIDRRQRRAGASGRASDPQERAGAGSAALVRARRASDAGGGTGRPGFDVRRLLDALDDRALVELIDVDGELHAVVARAGRVRHVRVGPVSAATAAVHRARFALRQAARLRPTDLASAGRQLQAGLLGSAVGVLGEGPVVVVPPARLHHTAWALCPALADRPVSASPSAAQWLRARTAAAPAAGRTVLIAGPGLVAGDAEVTALAERDPRAVVLRDGEATVHAALVALDGAAVAHVAAHGRHRSDNPMFSSLLLSDGPLTVHDFERLACPPARVVLSACDSGVMTPVASEEVLGLAAALLTQGSAGIICAVSEVNDEATRPVMTQVHAGLAAGLSQAEALLAARSAARGDVLATATSSAFACLGA